MHLDDTLSWSVHIEHVAKGLRLVCACMYNLRSVCDFRVKKMVFQSLGESILRYGLTIYGLDLTNLNVLNSILKRIAQSIICGTYFHNADPSVSMDLVDMLPVKNQFIFDILCNNYFPSEFKPINKKPRPVRSIEKFIVPRVHTNYGKKARNFYVPFYFNKLPLNPSITSYKQASEFIRSWVRNVD